MSCLDGKSDACACTPYPTSDVLARRQRRKTRSKRRRNIPDEILNDPELETAIAQLPVNYSFEVKKTVWKIREMRAKRVALQFPEGL